MNSTTGMMSLIIEQHRDAICCRYAHTHIIEIGHHGIDTLQTAPFLSRAQRVKPLTVHLYHDISMGLMRKDKMIGMNTQQPTQRHPVGCCMGCIVTTIFVDVELTIVA